MSGRCLAAALIAMTLGAAGPLAQADDLKVLAAGSVQEVLEDFGRQFAHDSDQPVAFSFATTGEVRSRIIAGEAFDLAIAAAPTIAELERAGKLVAGLSTELGRVGLGVAVREGMPMPDVTTADALKRALTAAKKVAFTDPKVGGTAGIYFANLLKSLGVADVVNKKAVLTAGGRDTAERVAKGEADIGITFISEITPVTGAKLVGLLPPDMRNYTTYVAGVVAASPKAETAHAFAAAAVGPSMRERWLRAGFETPAGR